MPEILTKYFGTVEYREADVLQFPAGLPGFEEQSQFLAIEPPADAPLTFLQSVRLPGLCFLALPMQGVVPEYQLAITREELAALHLDTSRQLRSGEEIACFPVIVVAESGRISANL